MSTIKDKLDIFNSQVEMFIEQPVVENPKVIAAPVVSIYTIVDAEDPIDVLVGAILTEEFTGITIVRQSASLYSIQDKMLTLGIEGESNDQLKVRIGSSWLDFADYLK